MGIKNLTKFIKEYVPEAIQYIPIDTYKSIAIDASILFYTFSVIGLESSSGSSNHLYGFFVKTIGFLQKNIRPIYVFDGKPPKEKFETINKRKEIKEKYKNEYEEAVTEQTLVGHKNEDNLETEETDQLTKLKNRFYYPTKEEIEEIKLLLSFMSVEYVEAVSEAEETCSLLCKKGIVQAVLSEDTDCLVHGCPIMLRKGPKPTQYMEIKLSVILTKMKFTQSKFIDYCLLCGSDYMMPIYGIGYKKALKMIQDNKWTGPDNIKNLFMGEPEYTIIKTYNSIQKEQLIELLVNKHNFSEQTIIINLKKLDDKVSSGSQAKITNFFKKQT